MARQGFIAWIARWKDRVCNQIRRRRIALTILVLLLIFYAFLLPGDIFRDPTSTVILDQEGQLLGARVAQDGQWRFPVNDRIPEKIRRATLAYEDRFFYSHPGFNPVSLFRALRLNLKAGKIISGGSTLTMQTIRLSRKGKSRSVWEKMIEIVLATRLELKLTKDEILALYIANAPYGGNVVGIEAAAWRYFGLQSEQLSWAEAAMLAVLPNAPALVHPGRNRETLLNKRNALLSRLAGLGWIDSITLQVSLAEPIPDKPVPMPKHAPHLLERFYREAPGTISSTTLRLDLQERANRLVEQHQAVLQSNAVHNAAVIILEVETGNVLAYVGNTPSSGLEEHGNEVDIIPSRRSTGSLLKPLLYAALLDDGKLLPASLVPDVPMNLNGFSPVNFDGQFEGAIPASKALSRSLNVPAVQMLRMYGVERFHHLLRSLGMNTLDRSASDYGLSLILGGAEGSLDEMSGLYASFSRVLKHYSRTGLYFSGDYRRPNYRRELHSKEGAGSREPGYFRASSLWYTYTAMEEVNRPEQESGWKRFSSSRKIAWKTGTSFGYRDAWAIGTSPEYVVGVWVGNADGEGRPGLTGMAAAAPLLFDLFGLLPASGWFTPPTDELVAAVVCRASGYLAGPDCPEPDTLLIPVNGQTAPACRYHRLVHLTADRRYRVTSDCYPVDSMVHEPWFVLPPLQEWYYKKHHGDYRNLPLLLKGCETSSHRSMDLLYPREEVRIFIPVELGGQKGRVIFEAVHSDPEAVIFWHLDDRFVAATRRIHQVELLPEPGWHVVTLVDGTGEELIRKFEAAGP